MPTKVSSVIACVALAFGLPACSAMPAPSVQSPTGEAVASLKAFPPSRDGQKQHVIYLPAERDEDALKVELIVGRTMRIDCNRHSFGGRLEERTAEGWGYTYYVLDNLGQSVSTMMGCGPGSERDAFVQSAHQQLVRYNSRLPLVIYAPDDVEVRYRIWRADAQQIPTPSGS